MKIGYFGNPKHSAYLLKRLLDENIEISFVVTNLDKAQKRNKKKVGSFVKQLAQENNISVFQFEKFDLEAAKALREFNADLFLVYAFGKILPKFIYEIPKYKTINLHASLLPKFRGASPVQASILSNLSVTGISLQYITEKMDEGDIILQEKLSIQKDDTGNSLLEKLTELGTKSVIKLLKNQNQIFPSTPQNHSLASYCKKITSMERKISFYLPSLEVYNKIRAFFDSYICYSFLKGKRVNFLEAKLEYLELEKVNKPGSIQIYQKRIFVECMDGFIELTKIQLEGKKPTLAKDFLNGYKVEKDSIFGEE